MALLFGQQSDCPKCGMADSFGRCIVGTHHLIFKCRVCAHDEFVPLPRLGKRIVYLDQFVLGNILVGTDPFWREVKHWIDASTSLQLATFPKSCVHDDESMVAGNIAEGLRETGRNVFGTTRFILNDEIENHQLEASLRAYLGLTDRTREGESWNCYFRTDPHRWNDIFDVHAVMPIHDYFVQLAQESKLQEFEDRKRIAASWSVSPRPIDALVREELLRITHGWLTCHRQFATGFHASFNRTGPPSWQRGAELVWRLATIVDQHRRDLGDPVQVVVNFLSDPGIQSVPFLLITARLWAVIGRRLGKNRSTPQQIKESDTNDVRFIAHYAPVCDAMFVDGKFNDIVTEAKLELPTRFFVGTKSRRDEFLVYMKTLVRDVSPSHLESLAFAYSQPQYLLMSLLKRGTRINSG